VAGFRFRVWVFCCVLAGHAPLQAQETSSAPLADIQHLVLDLRINWQQRQVFGTATLTLSLQRAANELALDAALLTVESVALSNGQALAFDYDGGERRNGLRIQLDRRHDAGETLTLAVKYRSRWVNESDPNNLGGSNGKGLRFFQPTFTEPMKRRQLWSMGEPDGSRYWFPDVHDPADLRTTEIKVTVDKPLSVVANGRLVSIDSNPDGTRSYHWRVDAPYASFLTSLVVGEYTNVLQRHRGIDLHSIGYPDERQAIADTVVRLPDMVDFFSELTGRRYPFSSYSHVFVQDLPWGTGSMGMSVLTENMIDDYRTHADYFYLWDGLEAEALANQWFGSQLSPRDWRHAWLLKGFAHYFDELYDEHRN
jgi:aminopeptidase N